MPPAQPLMKFQDIPYLLIFSLACLLSQFAQAGQPTVELPSKQRNGILQVKVPTAFDQIVLEGKTNDGWKPLSVRHLTVQSKGWTPYSSLSFGIPKGYKAQELRVLASSASFKPAFFKGKKDFAQTSMAMSLPLLGQVLFASSSASAPQVKSSEPSVQESEIWKIVGNRLFFFNQYRGLQVFDLSDPANPVRKGTLRLAAAGEQFFSLDNEGKYLALLGRTENDGADWQPSYAVFVLETTETVPKLITTLPIKGSVVESRLIGSRLYVVSRRWDAPAGSRSWVEAFDLAAPENPKSVGSLAISGAAIAVQTNAELLAVACDTSDNYYASTVHLIELGAEEPKLLKTLMTSGRVEDKFKLHFSDSALQVVSHRWQPSGSQTWLETFPKDGPSVSPLGQLEIEKARGETLHATRFDGNRLYAVTFRNIDPLFVVDISDPAQPVIRGHLEVPGWSSFIQPMGDRLLAVGVEDRRVTVSLFNVADADSPTLLSRVFLGNGASWSEASYDEKAVGFFEEAGVILVPYQSWNNAGWESATAVVSLKEDTLAIQSTIAHEFTARRATLLGNKILSISGQELLVEDASNLAAPRLLSELSLAWNADHVFTFGENCLIQVEDGDSGYFYRFAGLGEARKSILRVSTTEDPDELLQELDLGEGQIFGATERDGRLYVGQYVKATIVAAPKVRTWVFDCTAPPVLKSLGSVESDLQAGVFDFGNATALWPSPSTLVWHLPAAPFFWRVMPMPISQPVLGSRTASLAVWPGYYYGSTNPAALCPVSLKEGAFKADPTITIRGAGAPPSGATKAFAKAGFVFVDYSETDYRNAWVTRRWLQVLDFRNGLPVLRDRTSIPGTLVGIDQVDEKGALLFTSTVSQSGYRQIQACAYDGLDAYLISSQQTQSPERSASTWRNNCVYLAHKNGGINALGFDVQTGGFKELNSYSINYVPSEMSVIGQYLLASGYGAMEVASIKADGSLLKKASLQVPKRFWARLSRSDLVPQKGIWLPVGPYGVEFLDFAEIPTPRSSAR